ncbi:MAG: M3 family oligoendopeptidase, partial [Phyllobacterium sp.]
MAPSGRRAAPARDERTAFGLLPEWNLGDLYPSAQSSELKDDLKHANENARAFEQRWKGVLAKEVAKPKGGDFAASIKEFEALEDLIGKIVSFAGLVYAGDTSDPKNAKLYGDIQQKMTDASTHLIFYSLELNRIDDAAMEKAMDDNPAIGHYRPWLLDLRKDKPFQLEDRLEQLFHEKSITGRGAWNRLFDETMTSLRFEVEGDDLSLEPTLNLLQDADAGRRKAASEALARTFRENLRTFTLITNTLAKDKEISDRWRGFKDIADSRHLANRVEREVVDALAQAVQDAYPRLSHRYYALKAKWLGLDYLNSWDR